MGIAIIGLGQTHDKAPWHEMSWELWGLPWDEGYWRYYSRLFEMHDLRLLHKRGEHYLDRLKEIEVPLYMQEQYFPNVTQYPFDLWDYYNSSIAYMMALAIHENPAVIGLYGVDLLEDRFDDERHNIEGMIYYARAKGINVLIPEESNLCKFNPQSIFNGEPVEYIERYGWLG